MMEENMSDEEAIMRIAAAMKDNAPTQDEKPSVHTFLQNIATSRDTRKVANLRDDKEMNELGAPQHNVRGSFGMAQISNIIMGNTYFQDWFNREAEDTLSTSLSRGGFLVRQGTTQTKQIADITKRRKINRGMFGSKKVEESGGDTITSNRDI